MVAEKIVCADTVGKPLAIAIDELLQKGLQYKIYHTYPSKRAHLLLEDVLYVLRQRVEDDGTILLTAGAKMGKSADSR